YAAEVGLVGRYHDELSPARRRRRYDDGHRRSRGREEGLSGGGRCRGYHGGLRRRGCGRRWADSGDAEMAALIPEPNPAPLVPRGPEPAAGSVDGGCAGDLASHLRLDEARRMGGAREESGEECQEA